MADDEKDGEQIIDYNLNDKNRPDENDSENNYFVNMEEFYK